MCSRLTYLDALLQHSQQRRSSIARNGLQILCPFRETESHAALRTLRCGSDTLGWITTDAGSGEPLFLAADKSSATAVTLARR
jgi:hypothetical protein